MNQIANKTFKDYNFDDWFVLGSTLIIGIGLLLLIVTTYNTIK